MGSTDLLEREQSLAQLNATFGTARQGQGRLVVVEGPAGTGKSSLLDAATAAVEGTKVLRARGSELERELAFGAIRQLFETYVTAAAPAERERLLAGSAAPATRQVAPGLDSGSVAAGDGGFAALHAIYWLATNIAVTTPLVLVVDDLHWVDTSSLRALAYLARRIADLPIALVVALRPHEPGPDGALIDELCAEPGATTITVSGLGASSVAALVRAAVPDADDAACVAVFEAAAGNPFYVRELLRAHSATGNGLSAESVREAAIPSVADRVVRRIAHLGEDAPAVARAMAVLGDGRRITDVAALAGLDDDAAAGVASRLRRIEVLRAEDPFEFVHPLVRRSVYDSLTATERDASHAAAARLLRDAGAGADVVASQLTAMRPAGSEAIVDQLRDAAHEAMGKGAPDAAIGALRRAVDERAPAPPRSVLLRELGEIELIARSPAAIEHLEEAMSLATDPEERARIAQPLTEILNAVGQWGAANTVLLDAIVALDGSNPELAMDLETSRISMQAFDPKVTDELESSRERLLAMAYGDRWPARALSATLACTAAARGWSRAGVLELCDQALRDDRLLAERGAGGWASAQLLQALVLVEENDRARKVADVLALEGRRQGSLIAVLTAEGFRGTIAGREGDLAAAEEAMRVALDIALQNDLVMVIASIVKLFDDALVERDSLADVRQLVETLALDAAFLDSVAGIMAIEVRGLLRRDQGRRDEAIADLRAAGRVYERAHFGPTWSTWRSSLALALPATERDEALALVDEELTLTFSSEYVRPQAIALRTAGVVRGGDEGIEHLRSSIALLAPTTARLEHARSLVELGAALRRAGKRADARQALEEGRELAHRCGADRLTARAAEELRASGRVAAAVGRHRARGADGVRAAGGADGGRGADESRGGAGAVHLAQDGRDASVECLREARVVRARVAAEVAGGVAWWRGAVGGAVARRRWRRRATGQVGGLAPSCACRRRRSRWSSAGAGVDRTFYRPWHVKGATHRPGGT